MRIKTCIGKKQKCLLFFLIVSISYVYCDNVINRQLGKKSEPDFSPSTSPHVQAGLTRQLLDLTGGVRIKLVWLQSRLIDEDTMHYLPNYNEFLFNTPASQLVVFDTDEGEGRILDSIPSTRSTPLISRDGTRVLWSDYSKKNLYSINWDGSGKKILLNGGVYQVVCVQWDDLTGTEWVYISDVTTFPIYTMSQGTCVYRYPFKGAELDTANRELVSQEPFITPWTVSGDGNYAGGNMFWPYARIKRLPNGQLYQISDTTLFTCHAQIAPDTSYHFFYFPQSHFCLKMHKFNSLLDSNEYIGQIGLPWDCCCPRWTNKVNYLTAGSPYCGGWFYSLGGSPCPSDPKTIPPGTTGEFYIGKFDASLSFIVQWVRITDEDIRFRKAVGDGWLADGEGPSNR